MMKLLTKHSNCLDFDLDIPKYLSHNQTQTQGKFTVVNEKDKTLAISTKEK